MNSTSKQRNTIGKGHTLQRLMDRPVRKIARRSRRERAKSLEKETARTHQVRAVC
jgi:hypothetical protein